MTKITNKQKKLLSLSVAIFLLGGAIASVGLLIEINDKSGYPGTIYTFAELTTSLGAILFSLSLIYLFFCNYLTPAFSQHAKNKQLENATSQIEKLQALRDSGVLTKEEYETKILQIKENLPS